MIGIMANEETDGDDDVLLRKVLERRWNSGNQNGSLEKKLRAS